MENLGIKQFIVTYNPKMKDYNYTDYWIFWKGTISIFGYWDNAFQGNFFEF